jgi:hypothetical protein
MKFLRRKKKKEEPVVQVPLTVLMREIIYDSMMTPTEGIATLMGLPPISPEVADMEEQASEVRLSDISELIPFIDAHSDIAAKIATSAYMLDEENKEDLSEDNLEQLTALFRMVSLAASLSCVSTLSNIGLIESKAVYREQQ